MKTHSDNRVQQVAEYLYHLFLGRDKGFDALPHHVKEAYWKDAERMLIWMRDNAIDP